MEEGCSSRPLSWISLRVAHVEVCGMSSRTRRELSHVSVTGGHVLDEPGVNLRAHGPDGIFPTTCKAAGLDWSTNLEPTVDFSCERAANFRTRRDWRRTHADPSRLALFFAQPAR